MSGHGSMERESPRDSSPPHIFPTNSLESILSTVFSSEGLSLIVPINIPVFWKRPLFRVLAWRRWCQHGHSDCAQIICRRQHTTDRSAGTYTNSEGIIPNPRYSPTAIFLALSSLLHGIWLRKLVVSKIQNITFARLRTTGHVGGCTIPNSSGIPLALPSQEPSLFPLSSSLGFSPLTRRHFSLVGSLSL